MSVRFSFSYSNRDNDTGDDIENVDINFENPKSSAEVASKVQKFLVAAGYGNIEAVVNIARDDYYDGGIDTGDWQPGAYVIDEGGPVYGTPRVPEWLRKASEEDRENGDYYPGRC
jgi:hypothetical protein